jgi:hypothetical protein
MSQFISRWHELTGSGHNSLTLGKPASGDTVLYEELIRKDNSFLNTVKHTFSYDCKEGQEITAVLAYDKWSDNTGGYPEKESGGVGHRGVSICVTSQFNRGFHFHFVVYGK